jgi:integrase
MGVRVRPHGKSGKKFMVRISYTLPDGTKRRDRKVPEGVTSKSAAERWGHDRLKILLAGGDPEKKPVMTLDEFWPDFIERYAKANRQKHSEIVSKESRYKHHIQPHLGAKRMNEIPSQDVQEIKRRRARRAPSTLNNALTVLRTALRVAVSWSSTTGLLTMPCAVDGVKVQKQKMKFYESDVLERLLEGARKVDPRAELVVLLGADAGLRAGEMVGLEWGDLDFKHGGAHGSLTVNRTVYRKVIGPPKSWESRTVPLTERLAAALGARRQTHGGPVLTGHDGKRTDHWILRDWMDRAQRLAGVATGVVQARTDQPGKTRVRGRGRLHVLRHTFAARLVMEGVPITTVQALMGHAHVTTTEIYSHLYKSALSEGIAALDRAGKSGNVAATAKRKAVSR